MSRRTRTIVGSLVIVMLALSACSVRVPTRESLETAIPKAFLASDLGIVAAEAGIETSGFAVSVWAAAQLETDAVTAGDLRTLMELAVENTNLSDVDTLSIVATVGPPESETFIDLGAVGMELGFPDDDELASFSADWDDVVAFLDE
jgi:hypothetical protein